MRESTMPQSMKNLEATTRKINKKLEDKAEQKGKELASNIMARTSQGHGLWNFFLWPAWLFVFCFSGKLIQLIMEGYSWPSALQWIGFFIAGYSAASQWYNSDFTIKHPFYCSILTLIVIIIVSVIFREKGLELL